MEIFWSLCRHDILLVIFLTTERFLKGLSNFCIAVLENSFNGIPSVCIAFIYIGAAMQHCLDKIRAVCCFGNSNHNQFPVPIGIVDVLAFAQQSINIVFVVIN